MLTIVSKIIYLFSIKTYVVDFFSGRRRQSETILERIYRLKREYGEGGNDIVGIHGRNEIKFMETEIRAPQNVLGILKNKLRVQATDLPPVYQEKNNKSAVANMDFIRSKVSEYVKNQVVEKCYDPPRFINPLSVAKKTVYSTGEVKSRLVLDVSRSVNTKVKKLAQRPDSLETIEQHFRPGLYGTVLDLRAMFHNCKLQSDTSELFGFKVKRVEGGHDFYKYLALPFGYRNAGAIMQALTTPIVRYLRGAGVTMNLYIDDFLILGEGEEELKDKVELVVLVFELAGYRFAWDKSSLTPSKVVEYLGLVLDFQSMTYSIDADKRKHIRQMVVDVLHKEQVNGKISTREVAACVGKLVSLRKALGHIIHICLRHTQHELGVAVHAGNQGEPNWEGFMTLDEDCVRELMLAAKLVKGIENRRFPPAGEKLIFSLDYTDYKFGQDLKYNDQDFEVYVSDASDRCAFVYEARGFSVVEEYGFDQNEQNRGSGRRELLAISKFLQKRGNDLQGSRKNIFWVTDSKNVFFWFKFLWKAA